MHPSNRTPLLPRGPGYKPPYPNDYYHRNEFWRDRYTPPPTPHWQSHPVPYERFPHTPMPYANYNGFGPNAPAPYNSEYPPLPPVPWRWATPSPAYSPPSYKYTPSRYTPGRRQFPNKKFKKAPAPVKATGNLVSVNVKKRPAEDSSITEPSSPPAKKICPVPLFSPDSIAACSPKSDGADSPKSGPPQPFLKTEVPPPGPHPNFLEAYPTKTFTADELQQLMPPEWESDRVAQFHKKDLCRRDVTNILSTRTNFVRKEVEELCGFRISEIEAVENPYLWLMYQLRRWEMAELQEGKVAHERFFFHGTKGVNIYPIIRDNFDFRLAGTNKGHKYGFGVNFCAKANFCQMYANQSLCLLVARVPVLRASVGQESTVLPDKGCDATNNGRDIFVKFHDHEFYPELLVHFRRV